MSNLINLLPHFVARLRRALIAVDRSDLASQLSEVAFVSHTYDSTCDAAYIYVQSPRKLNTVEQNIIGIKHGETIAVEDPHSVYIDVDNFGRLRGFELLQGGNIAAMLSRLINHPSETR